MKIAALLTGRGNNTLKDKNVLPVLGKPLLYYPAMAAKTCNLITDFYVSSDDEKIYNPQIQISAESETKRSIFREKDKTKRSKKESAQHSKSRNKSFVMTSVSAL